MALINCPECGEKISSYAETCPHCGIPKEMMDMAQTPKAEEVVIEKKNYEVAKFGRYPQGENGETMPLEWFVVSKEKERILLVSKAAIDARCYSDKKENDELMEVSWDTCSMRDWLNEEFINEAFDENEKSRILQVEIPVETNPQYKIHENGEPTEDKIFLLNIQEVLKYFPTSDQRKCQVTPYTTVQKSGLHKDNKAWWWLRSIGSGRTYAAIVDDKGEIIYSGGSVDYEKNTVRPALWLNLKA